MKNLRIYIYSAIVIAILVVVAVIASYFIMRSNTPVLSNNESDSKTESATFKKYRALKGEEYDKAFLANIIVNHESSLAMAEQANRAGWQKEITDLAASITNSRKPEVNSMREWQIKWGYTPTPAYSMTGMHENGGSMEGVEIAKDDLKGLAGVEFDKKFLELMITHDQDAVDIAKTAATNASHQEVKDLARKIITTQTNEMEQMKLLQKVWGYKRGM